MSNKIFIDATDAVIGRVASYGSKKAMEGYEIFVFNVEKAVMSGRKEYFFKKFKQRIDRGEPFHGPFYPRTVVGIVKRIFRGMLPYKTPSGRVAFDKVKVYEGVPESYKGASLKTDLKTKKEFDHIKFVTIKSISQKIGGVKY